VTTQTHRARVLEVRIHLPPAESLVRTENGLLREAELDRRRVEAML